MAVAWDLKMAVAYLPGLAMERIAGLRPGHATTDAPSVFIIAEAARTMPHALRRVDTRAEALTDLEMIIGYDDDLRAEATRIAGRLRGLLVTVHPVLERTVGHHRDRYRGPCGPVLATHGGPQGLALAGIRVSWKTP